MSDVVLSLDLGLLFILVLLTGWLFFTNLYFARRQIILGFTQFCFAMPLTFVVGSLSVGYALGYAVTFIIPMLSLVILADAFYGRVKPQ
jgi:hypothetical protein